MGLFVVGSVKAIRAIMEPLRSPDADQPLVEVIYQKRFLARGPKIVAIGGGTGLSMLLRGLKEHTSNLTAVVTVADDGGSSGKLREQFGVPAVGDIRNCIVALADAEPLMSELLQYRFPEGEGTGQLDESSSLAGHAVGNLLIAALTAVKGGDFEEGVRQMNRVLAVRGQVLPVSPTPVILHARSRDGQTIEGQSRIARASGIERVWLAPDDVVVSEDAVHAIEEADVIVLGPGSLFTSILPSLLMPAHPGRRHRLERGPDLRLQRRRPGRRDRRVRPGRPHRGHGRPHRAGPGRRRAGQQPRRDRRDRRLPQRTREAALAAGGRRRRRGSCSTTSSTPAIPITTIRSASRRRSCGSWNARDRPAAGPAWPAPPDPAALVVTARSRVDRDLVLALRSELAAIDPARACDRRALALGIGRTTATRDPVLARLAIRLGLGSTPRSAAARRSRRATEGGEDFAWGPARDHCRAAYLRGLFLAHGSLSLANGRTHLEFVVDPAQAPLLAAHLAEEGMPASWRLRRGRGVVTWKSAETIVTFLRRAGAGAALLELEARQVSRAMTGELNRVINAESANLTRAVEAAGRNLAAIEVLTADGRLAEQPYVVRVVADARRESPESTLTELAERIGMHRSAVQRALERIERLALHDDGGGGRRAAPRRRGPRRAGDPAMRSPLA